MRENLNIAVAMAGIPQAIKPVLASNEGTNPVTFLRRANRIDLGHISETKVYDALRKPVEDAGITWDLNALGEAVHAWLQPGKRVIKPDGG
ncbi:hypothetical protein [Corynebacterium uterequi]|uniref:Uncharacterized protein n=1 Tax=Corynebacterium uterequi TaxID=1072256 RepID=A0A0G3HBG9_9CORY|nr:hypothetical protein [Corynebacterium uterequi]AKK10045.1 hypothetical protein CUTER_00065 [Corynebacterium uterequi]